MLYVNSYHACLMQEPHEVVFLNVHKTGNLRNVKCIIFHMLHFKIYLMKSKIRTSENPDNWKMSSHRTLSPDPPIYSPLSPLAPLYAHLI